MANNPERFLQGLANNVNADQLNCFNFAYRIMNNGIGLVEPCSMGDPDYVRGIYMNMLKVFERFDDIEIDKEDKKDDAAKLFMDRNVSKMG